MHILHNGAAAIVGIAIVSYRPQAFQDLGSGLAGSGILGAAKVLGRCAADPHKLYAFGGLVTGIGAVSHFPIQVLNSIAGVGRCRAAVAALLVRDGAAGLVNGGELGGACRIRLRNHIYGLVTGDPLFHLHGDNLFFRIKLYVGKCALVVHFLGNGVSKGSRMAENDFAKLGHAAVVADSGNRRHRGAFGTLNGKFKGVLVRLCIDIRTGQALIQLDNQAGRHLLGTYFRGLRGRGGLSRGGLRHRLPVGDSEAVCLVTHRGSLNKTGGIGHFHHVPDSTGNLHVFLGLGSRPGSAKGNVFRLIAAVLNLYAHGLAFGPCHRLAAGVFPLLGNAGLHLLHSLVGVGEGMRAGDHDSQHAILQSTHGHSSAVAHAHIAHLNAAILLHGGNVHIPGTAVINDIAAFIAPLFRNGEAIFLYFVQGNQVEVYLAGRIVPGGQTGVHTR